MLEESGHASMLDWHGQEEPKARSSARRAIVRAVREDHASLGHRKRAVSAMNRFVFSDTIFVFGKSLLPEAGVFGTASRPR